MADIISGWVAFWDKPHSIYVNARHKDVHYRLLADQIAALVAAKDAHVLDYGSGEALYADRIATRAAELLLCDGAPSVRAAIAARFAQNAKIRVVAPDDLAALPAQSLDLIVLHSVAQYLSRDETDALFASFHRLLKPDGALVVSDVIPPHVATFTDAAELLRFAAGHRFLGAALGGLLRTFVSDYRRLRTRYGITRYAEADMIAKLGAAGFAARREATIIGHNRARMAFIAQPR